MQSEAKRKPARGKKKASQRQKESQPEAKSKAVQGKKRNSLGQKKKNAIVKTEDIQYNNFVFKRYYLF